jgi:hypothetical protein
MTPTEKFVHVTISMIHFLFRVVSKMGHNIAIPFNFSLERVISLSSRESAWTKTKDTHQVMLTVSKAIPVTGRGGP